MKHCTKCSRDLPLNAFWKDKSKPDGLQRYCVECKSSQDKKWRSENPDYGVEWARNNPDLAQKYSLAYRRGNLEKLRRRDRERYAANREASVKRVSEYNKTIRPRRAAAERERRKNPIHALHGRVSASIRIFLSQGKGGRKTEDLLGYSMRELAGHLEKQFQRGMSWDNMGEWHIDHILPLSSFDITGADDPDFRVAWAITNLRPLWAEENLSKQNKRLHLV